METAPKFFSWDRSRLTLEAIEAARKLLRYAFVEIEFKYELLTETERTLTTKEEFDLMVSQFRLK